MTGEPQEPGDVLVNRAIRDALRDGAARYDARVIRVDARLGATVEVDTREDELYQALYTIFRALPDRVAPGSALHVATADRAGGDVELVWEAHDGVVPAAELKDVPSLREKLRAGPYGDLLDLALMALEDYCRARLGYLETEDRGRRVLALIPPLKRDLSAYPLV